MSKEIQATSEDGTIKYQILTPKYLDEACEVIKLTLFTSGILSKAVGTPDDPEALTELSQLPRTSAQDGVSVIAIDTTKDKVIGVAFNKIFTPNTPYFDNFKKTFKNIRALKILDYIVTIATSCDLFNLCQVDTFMEIHLLGTLPEYRQRGIGTKMCQISINIARNLMQGINVKKSIDGKELPLEPIPKAVTAIFSSAIPQRIGRELGFTIAAEKNITKITLMGEPLEIESETPTTLEYKKL